MSDDVDKQSTPLLQAPEDGSLGQQHRNRSSYGVSDEQSVVKNHGFNMMSPDFIPNSMTENRATPPLDDQRLPGQISNANNPHVDIKELNNVTIEDVLGTEEFACDSDTSGQARQWYRRMVEKEMDFRDPKKLCFEWSKINFMVKQKGAPGGTRNILTDCYGKVYGGEVCALMGPSGAGKSTLMNLLAARQQWTTNKAWMTGNIMYGGKKVTYSHLKESVGYVMQQDSFIESQTVWESVYFAATMKLGEVAGVSRDSATRASVLTANVEETIKALGLWHIKDARIRHNSRAKGLSGGERKRVSAAIELVSRPSIIFLDEPTTGLDSFSSLQLVDFLRKFAQEQNAIVVATIHQPSSELFENFDRVISMRQGKILFQGINGKRARAFLKIHGSSAAPSTGHISAGPSKISIDKDRHPSYTNASLEGLARALKDVDAGAGVQDGLQNQQLSANDTSSDISENLIKNPTLVDDFLGEKVQEMLAKKADAETLPGFQRDLRIIAFHAAVLNISKDSISDLRRSKILSGKDDLTRTASPASEPLGTTLSVPSTVPKTAADMSIPHLKLLDNRDQIGHSGITCANVNETRTIRGFLKYILNTELPRGENLANALLVIAHSINDETADSIANQTAMIFDIFDSTRDENYQSVLPSLDENDEKTLMNVMDETRVSGAAGTAVPTTTTLSKSALSAKEGIPGLADTSEIRCNLFVGVVPNALKRMHMNHAYLRKAGLELPSGETSPVSGVSASRESGPVGNGDISESDISIPELGQKVYSAARRTCGVCCVTWCRRLCSLIAREATDTIRDWEALAFRIGLPVLQVSFYGIVFFDVFRQLYQGQRTGFPSCMSSADKSLFTLTTVALWNTKLREVYGAIGQPFYTMNTQSAGQQLLILSRQRAVFLREYSSGMYDIFSYLLAQYIVEVCVLITITITLHTLEFAFVGYYGHLLGNYWMVALLACMASSSMGVFISALAADSPDQAYYWQPLFIVAIPALYGGFFRPVTDLPKVFQWFGYLFPMNHASKAYDLISFRMGVLDQAANGNPDLGLDDPAYATLIQATNARMTTRGIEPTSRFWVYWVPLIVLFIFYRALAAMVLALNSRSIY